MHFRSPTAFILTLAVAAGCNSASEVKPDSAVLDAIGKSDSPVDIGAAKNTDTMPSDTKVDTGSPPDAALDAPARDVTGPVDVAIDKTDPGDTFIPGPTEPLVVNSGDTGTFNLAAGTWKVFSFDTVADGFYCVGGLGNGFDGYIGTSPSVSPTEYMEKSDSKGVLNFSTYSSGKRYIAVVASGADASGSFQIAEGGALLTSGENAVTLTAPDKDNYTFFHFSIAPGHSYSISVAGDAKNPVGLGLSPRAERTTSGQFAFPLSSISSPLPIADQPIPLESAVLSKSRMYFLFIRVKETANLTVTITLAS